MSAISDALDDWWEFLRRSVSAEKFLEGIHTEGDLEKFFQAQKDFFEALSPIDEVKGQTATATLLADKEMDAVMELTCKPDTFVCDEDTKDKLIEYAGGRRWYEDIMIKREGLKWQHNPLIHNSLYWIANDRAVVDMRQNPAVYLTYGYVSRLDFNE